MSILGLSIELRERTNDEFYVVTHCSKADAALIFSAETQTRILSIYSFFSKLYTLFGIFTHVFLYYYVSFYSLGIMVHILPFLIFVSFILRKTIEYLKCMLITLFKHWGLCKFLCLHCVFRGDYKKHMAFYRIPKQNERNLHIKLIPHVTVAK